MDQWLASIAMALIRFLLVILLLAPVVPPPGVMAPRAYLPFTDRAKPAEWDTTCVKSGLPFTDIVYIGKEAYLSQQSGEIYRDCILWAHTPSKADGEMGLTSLATDGTRLWAAYADLNGIITVADINLQTGDALPVATFGPAAKEHSSAALHYLAPDLLIGLGDNEEDWSAQSDTLPNGKLWALGSTGLRLIAKGFRNPWQISRLSGKIYISDVGNQQREEASMLPPLTPDMIFNFGWPCFEGTHANAYNPETCNALVPGIGSQPPALEYPRSLGRGIVGTALINGEKTYADFTGVIRTWNHTPVREFIGFISKMTPTSAGVAVLTFSPDAGAGSIVKLEEYK